MTIYIQVHTSTDKINRELWIFIACSIVYPVLLYISHPFPIHFFNTLCSELVILKTQWHPLREFTAFNGFSDVLRSYLSTRGVVKFFSWIDENNLNIIFIFQANLRKIERWEIHFLVFGDVAEFGPPITYIRMEKKCIHV